MTVDCELIRGSFPLQPVATWTALALVIAGLMLTRHRGLAPRVYGILVASVGATSFALHGFGVPGVAESIALIALGSWTAMWSASKTTGSTALWWMLAVAAVGVLVGLQPTLRDVATGIPAVAAAALLLPQLRTSDEIRLAFIVFPAALVVYALSRTGAPWCVPSSPLQGHGLWHLMAAAALWLVGEGLSDHPERVADGGSAVGQR